MKPSNSSTDQTATASAGRSETPSIAPVFPLILLETLRDTDLPDELLEDEDVSVSMPRRLGLSEVVRQQIQKFLGEVKQKRPQSAAIVEDLIRLVIRRPDADEIFVEAGRRVAQRFFSERPVWIRKSIRFLPRPLALIVGQRAARKMFKRLVGPSRFSVTRGPVALSIESSLTSNADPGGAACAFYTGAFAEALELYTGRRYRVSHPICRATGDGSACKWSVEISA